MSKIIELEQLLYKWRCRTTKTKRQLEKEIKLRDMVHFQNRLLFCRNERRDSLKLLPSPERSHEDELA